MGMNYIKESDINIKDKNEEEKNAELILSIIETKKNLYWANRNFEFAEEELIDYFLYQIKAYQAKLDYLLRQAKTRKIEVDAIDSILYKENKVV